MQHISTDTLYKLRLKRKVNLSGTGRNFTHFLRPAGTSPYCKPVWHRCSTGGHCKCCLVFSFYSILRNELMPLTRFYAVKWQVVSILHNATTKWGLTLSYQCFLLLLLLLFNGLCQAQLVFSNFCLATRTKRLLACSVLFLFYFSEQWHKKCNVPPFIACTFSLL